MRSTALHIIALAAMAAMLSGCSSRVERFERPSWGLNGQATAQLPAAVPYRPAADAVPQRQYAERREAPPTTSALPPTSPSPASAQQPPPTSNSPYAYRGGRDPVTGRAEHREGAGASASDPTATGAGRTYYDPSSATVARPYLDAPRQDTGTRADAGSVEVQPGDTLSAIARRHNITIAALKTANGLSSDAIATGQRLSLPVR